MKEFLSVIFFISVMFMVWRDAPTPAFIGAVAVGIALALMFSR